MDLQTYKVSLLRGKKKGKKENQTRGEQEEEEKRVVKCRREWLSSAERMLQDPSFQKSPGSKGGKILSKKRRESV